MGTTAEKLNKLLDTKTAIKEAIIAKGQTVSDTDTFASYAEKIEAIDTLTSGTADATATASEILSGKTAYVDGAKVTGTMTNNGAKTASLNAGGSYTIPAGYHNGSGKVTANALSGQTSGTAAAADILSGKTAWVGGSQITGTIATKTASNLSASGATVTVPAGYYASQATKSVSTATQATPSISVSSAGLITASSTQSAGYVSAGTKSATKQLTVQAAKTVTPTKSSQTAAASGVYTTGAVTVAAIPDEYQDVSGVTAGASDVLSGKVIVDADGEEITGTIATKTASNMTVSGATVTAPAGYYASAASKSVATATQATPSVSVSSAGLITASATQSAGYVSSGTKSATKQLTVQAAKTVTPGTSNQTAVSSGVYTTGAVTVAGDADLKAGNIKSGVNIFGVDGTFTSDATASASDIVSGKTAYVDGNVVTGSVEEVAAGAAAAAGNYGFNESSDEVLVFRGRQSSDKLYRANSYATISVPYDEFGDATPADVAAGKWFTSSAGWLIEGTASGGAAAVTEAVEIEATTTAGLATFTTSQSISKVCSITFVVESAEYYGKNTYLYLKQADGTIARFAGEYYQSESFIVEDSSGSNSGESISGKTVTYGISTSSGWKTRIPVGSYIYGTITYIPG